MAHGLGICICICICIGWGIDGLMRGRSCHGSWRMILYVQVFIPGSGAAGRDGTVALLDKPEEVWSVFRFSTESLNFMSGRCIYC